MKEGATLLVEPTAHWRRRDMRINPNTVIRDEIRDPLERGLMFRARLIEKLSEVRDQKALRRRGWFRHFAYCRSQR
jgi:hypothetical protein